MKFSKIPREIKIADLKNSDGMVFYRSEKHAIAFIAFRFSPQSFYSSMKTTLSEIGETTVIEQKTALSQLVSNLMNTILKDIGGCILVIEDLNFNIEISLETGEVDFCFKLEGESLEDVQRKKLFLEEKLKNFINIKALNQLTDEYLLEFYFKSINTKEIKSITIEKIENTKLLKIYHRDFEDKTTMFHLFLQFNKKIEELNANTISQTLNSLRTFGLNGNFIICIQLDKKHQFETQYFLQVFGKSKKIKDHVDIVLNQSNCLKFCTFHEPTVFDIKDLLWRRIPEGGAIRIAPLLHLEEELIVRQFLQTYSLYTNKPSFHNVHKFEDNGSSNRYFETPPSEYQRGNWKNLKNELSENFEDFSPKNITQGQGRSSFQQAEPSFHLESTEWDPNLSQINQLIETNEYLENEDEFNQNIPDNAIAHQNYQSDSIKADAPLPFIDEKLNIPLVPEKKIKIKRNKNESDKNLIRIPQLNKIRNSENSISIPPKPNLPPETPHQTFSGSEHPKPNLSPLTPKRSQKEASIPVPPKPNLPPETPHQTFSGSEHPKPNLSPLTPKRSQKEASIPVPPKPNLPNTLSQNADLNLTQNIKTNSSIPVPPMPSLPVAANQNESLIASDKIFGDSLNPFEEFDAPNVPSKSMNETKNSYEKSSVEEEMEEDIIDKTFKFESFEELIQKKEPNMIESVIQIFKKSGLPFRKMSEEMFELPTLSCYLFIFNEDSLAPLIRSIWLIKDRLKHLIIIFEDHKSLVKYYHKIGLTKYPFIYAFILEKFSEDALRSLKLTNRKVSVQQNP